MSKKLFDKEKVGGVLVQMCSKSMAECMTCDASLPSELILMGVDMTAQIESIDRLILSVLLREQITHRSATVKPVLCEDIQ